MGKIKVLKDNEIVGGTDNTTLYPVTSTKAVYNDDNKRLDDVLRRNMPINISTEYNNKHVAEVLTLSQAISKVVSKDRTLGFQGKYLATNGWHTIIYTGDSLTTWTDSTKWIDLDDKIFNSISKNASFAGIATPTTNPGTPEGPVFYLAVEVGVYPNFNNIEVTEEEAIIFKWDNGSWSKKVTGFATQDKLTKLESHINEINNNVVNFEDIIRNHIEKYKPIIINGDVVNAADEEDITSENNLLKFKNRSTLSGMGYIILRKNKSFEEQVTEPNTIYEIRYEFDLNNTKFTLPLNCVLKFNGGSLSNGTLVPQRLKAKLNIINDSVKPIFDNVITDNTSYHYFDIAGTGYTRWFKNCTHKSLGFLAQFDTMIINSDLDLGEYNEKQYQNIDFYKSTKIEGNNHLLTIKTNTNSGKGLFSIYDGVVTFNNLRILVDHNTPEKYVSILNFKEGSLHVYNCVFEFTERSSAHCRCIGIFPKENSRDLVLVNSVFKSDGFAIEGANFGNVIIDNCDFQFVSNIYWRGDKISFINPKEKPSYGTAVIRHSIVGGGFEWSEFDNVLIEDCELMFPDFGYRGALPDKHIVNNLIFRRCVFVGLNPKFKDTTKPIPYCTLNGVTNVMFDCCEFKVKNYEFQFADQRDNAAIWELNNIEKLYLVNCTYNFYNYKGIDKWVFAPIKIASSVKEIVLDGNIFINETGQPWANISLSGIEVPDEEDLITIKSTIKNKVIKTRFTRNAGWGQKELYNVTDKLVELNSGTFDNKPKTINNPNLAIGYSYFCTDKSSTEGEANGVMIYHKGNDIWVDALGKVIS